MSDVFSPHEIEYYSRHMLVRDFGGPAQARLKRAHIGIIGLGGIGAPLALYLAASGIGRLTLYEDDVVERTNLHRQILYCEEDIGNTKLALGRDALARRNPNIELNCAGRFTDETHFEGDLLIDGSDDVRTRLIANRRAALDGFKLLSASIAQWEGQILYCDPACVQGCYECLYPGGPKGDIPACSEAGVIGPAAGVIGTLAALEALKIIAGKNAMQPATLLLFDGLEREMRQLRVAAKPDCPVCQS